MRVRTLNAAALIAAWLAAGSPAAAEIIDRVMAVVGAQVITLSDVRAAEAFRLVPPSAGSASPENLLGSLVNRQLMLSEVERYSAPEPERELVERRMTGIRAAFPAEADYARALARTAMSDERLRTAVADNLRIEAYVEQRFGGASQPTTDDVQRYYREHPAEFTSGGKLAPFEEVQQTVQQKAAAERKRALVADWLDRLRRREFVSTLSQAGR